jgi:hypothetical protein
MSSGLTCCFHNEDYALALTGSVRDFQLGDGGDILSRLLSVAICVAFFVYGDFIVHDFFTRLVLVPVIWVGLLIVMGIVLPDTVTWLRKARGESRAAFAYSSCRNCLQESSRGRREAASETKAGARRT